MKQFLKYVGEYLRVYPQIRLTRSEEIWIRNQAIRHLGLINVNEMRDRFEGQAFYDKTIMNVGGLMALQKHLNHDLINVDETDLGDFQPHIKLNDEILEVNVFDFGALPLIKINKVKDSVYFIVQKDNLTFLLCGFATVDVIKNHVIEPSGSESHTDKHMVFIGFKYLEKIA